MRRLVTLGAALTVAGAAAIAAAPTASAYTYSTRTQRYDLYPPGCNGYLAVVFTWMLRSDGASLNTKVHTGNNMDCGSGVNLSELKWGAGCPPPIWKFGPYDSTEAHRGQAVDYSYPFGTAYASSAGHPTSVWKFGFSNGQLMTTSDSAHPC